MHMPYMRIAIYALTFMTYAYTGYGSNVIASLRDAIIAAEAVFGDVFKNAIHVARKFQTVHEVFDAAIEENCVYKCPNGATPVRNKFHTPSSDGCGSLGLGIATEYLPVTEMDNCCDEHDICYDTCNKDKELCDIEFKRCLYNYCDKYEKTAVGGDIMVKGCKGGAKMLFTSTVTLGCKSFLDAQAKSCYCGGPQQQQQQQKSPGSSKPTSGSSENKDNAYNRDTSYNKDYSYSKDNSYNKDTPYNKDNSYNKNKDYNKRYNEKKDSNYNTYPNNIRQEYRQREEPPSYGWKDSGDL